MITTTTITIITTTTAAISTTTAVPAAHKVRFPQHITFDSTITAFKQHLKGATRE